MVRRLRSIHTPEVGEGSQVHLLSRCGSRGLLTGAVHAPFSLLADLLQTVLALHLVFDDRITRCEFGNTGNGVQSQAYAHEINDFVKERPK